MTKAELVDQVAAAVHLPKHQTDAVITRFLQTIMEALHAGESVELRGFGRFRLRHRQPRAGRNPRTGDTVQIPAKTIPAFTAGKAFQALVWYAMPTILFSWHRALKLCGRRWVMPRLSWNSASNYA
jgi:nucleoid DNA-binding protein